MVYVPKGTGYLPNKSVKELLDIYRKEMDRKASIRLLCAIYRKNGKTIPDIANILLIPTSTVSDHLRRLSNDFNELYDKHIQKKQPRLTMNEHGQLIEAI